MKIKTIEKVWVVISPHNVAWQETISHRRTDAVKKALQSVPNFNTWAQIKRKWKLRVQKVNINFEVVE